MAFGLSAGAAALVGGIAGPVIGGLIGSSASSNAADAQQASAAQATALQQQQYEQNRTDQAPFREAGYNALAQYQQALPGLMQPFTGANVASDPGYQFGLNEGRNALDNSAANHGGLYSGAQQKAITQFGTDYATTKFGDAFNRDLASKGFQANQLQSLSGLGQTATGQVANAGMNYANQAGQNITGAGNARASGYIGGANALTGAIGQGYNNYNNNQLLSMLQPRQSQPNSWAIPTSPYANYTGDYNGLGQQ